MKILSEILALNNVDGAILCSLKGEFLGWGFSPALKLKMEREKWQTVFHPDGMMEMIQRFEGMEEVEFFFEEKKVLLRKAGKNYLLVVMGRDASTDMVRLVSDALMVDLRKAGKSGKFARFFRI